MFTKHETRTLNETSPRYSQQTNPIADTLIEHDAYSYIAYMYMYMLTTYMHGCPPPLAGEYRE